MLAGIDREAAPIYDDFAGMLIDAEFAGAFLDDVSGAGGNRAVLRQRPGGLSPADGDCQG